jgi:tetratricopeptide (TPR) repeat protein
MAFEQEDLDFQITFFENLLKKNPDFVEALIALGDAYTKRGRYEDGLKIDQRLVQLKPDEPVVHYNLACSYSLLKMADLCLEALRKAIQLGYRDFVFMEKDPDLDFIKKDPRYKDLFSKWRGFKKTV